MKRTLIAGLSVLVLSALTTTAARADSRVEAQLRLTHPTRMATNSTVQPVATPRKTAVNETGERGQTANPQVAPQLSERDRLILQYQTQTVIPAETR